jgi:hypothetical protein
MTTDSHDNDPYVTPPAQIPPAFQANGHGPSAMMAGLIAQLPQMLASAFASVLTQVPVRAVTQQLKCAQCVHNRLAWISANQLATDAAQAAYAQAVTASRTSRGHRGRRSSWLPARR